MVCRPVNEWHAIAIACTHSSWYLFRHAIVAHAKLYVTSFVYSFVSVLITNSLIFLYKISIRVILQQPSLVSIYCHLGDHNENQLCKDFCQIKNKQTHCLHISAQQTNRLRLRESLQTDTRSSYLGFTSLNVLPNCLLSTPSL